MSIICGTMSFFVFISTKMYPLLLQSLDLHGCLSIYGCGCIIGFIFVLLVVKETSGTSLDDVGVEEKKKYSAEKRLSTPF